MSLSLHIESLYSSAGWRQNVRLKIAGGRIETIEEGVLPEAQDEKHKVVVPALPNLHSHAFQRAMAGLAETRGPGSDSFWSWRELMYRLALRFMPEQVEAVASQLYMEMLEAGFGRVGEFHYLHHDSDGGHYANIAEMAERVAAASVETGISLTLLPVFYAHSGFGAQLPTPEQRRFIHSVDDFALQMDACRDLVKRLPDGRLGIAPHSLRAVTPEELHSILPLADGGPIHIHVAEQTREVEDCLRHLGRRPVEWLLDAMPVDARWCMIHATHMSEAETVNLAKTGAVAGLCPVTEANLGDGIFDGIRFRNAGGFYGVGSDSNVLISVADELRQLEYSQRLGERVRNAMALPNQSTGRALFEAALAGGTRALAGLKPLEAGSMADLVSLDLSAAPYLRGDQILDSWIFGQGVSIDCVWVNGIRWVSQGRHHQREKISRNFRTAMQELLQL
ncbi:formimidoylglutamate deiminase [Rhizobium helianthi]|uniref:Formimidoylglutamate deiminase n=1 Tax=Rhizobium helianthi TaxID=1132695 RepID=A0ABW4M3V7_9HYPH